MRRMLLTAAGALVLVVLTVLATLSATGNFGSKPLAAVEWDYKTDDATEAEMLASLNPAPADIVEVLRRDAAKSKDAMFIAAAKRAYVAHADVAIARVDTPMVIVLPPDIHWTRGQLGNVVLLRVQEVTPKGVSSGHPFTDVMCNAELVGLARGACMNTEAQRPGTWDEMLTHLRRPTEPELAKWLGNKYIPGETQLFYVAESNFVAAPEYKFYETPGETFGIFMPPGIRVLGGQLGYMDLYQINPNGTYTEFIGDCLCYFNDSPTIWEGDKDEAGRPNYAKPSTFAPDVELKRVSDCKR